MGWSPLSTETHNTSQFSARTTAPNMVVLHHGATTDADWIISVETSGSKQVSSHQVVKDARNAGIVQEQYRAWSLSDAYWDSRSFTVECANESTSGWTISASSHETLAQQVADWATRYGFWPHRDGDPATWTVIGHREVYTIHGGSYATACPGGMDLDWIAKRAQQYMTGLKKIKENEAMIIYEAKSDSKDGLIKKGNFYMQGEHGTLRWMAGSEYGVYRYWADSQIGIPFRHAPWAGEDIRKLVTMYGLYNIGAQSALNGTVLIQDPFKVVTPPAAVSIPESVIADAVSKAIADYLSKHPIEGGVSEQDKADIADRSGKRARAEIVK